MSKGWAFINCDDLIGAGITTSRDPLPATSGNVNLDFTNTCQIYYGTLTGNINFSFINPTLCHEIILQLDGNFTVTLDPEYENHRGAYVGTKKNVYVIKCIDPVTPLHFGRIYSKTP